MRKFGKYCVQIDNFERHISQMTPYKIKMDSDSREHDALIRIHIHILTSNIHSE